MRAQPAVRISITVAQFATLALSAVAAVSAAMIGVMTAAGPAAAAEWPAPQASYAADSVTSVAGFELPARVYHDRGLERREMTVEGLQQIVILRPDLGTAYMIIPTMNMGMEMDISNAPIATPEQFMEAMQPEPVGSETVAGLDTTKYHIAGTDEDGNSVDAFVWATDDGIVARMEGAVTADGRTEQMRSVLSNVQRGPQDPSLFEPPAGLSLMQIDPSMMQMVPGLQGN